MVVVRSEDRAYVLGDLIGAGGMGQVYAAKDATSRPVAVKLLHRELASDPGMVARFHGEAYAGRQVSHRNVVRVIDQGCTEDGTPFLVMERVDGVLLARLIRTGVSLSLARTRTIAMQILSGLAAIHRAGLVHGDVKCDNVLVDSFEGADHVTIIDLGLARPPGANPVWLDPQMVSGTPAYVAPEMIRGEPASEASDLYAVAVVLYEVLTGTTPFGGGHTTDILERHLYDDVVPPSVRCPDRTIPPSFEQALLRGLNKRASARHASAESFAAAIEQSLPPASNDLRCTAAAFRADAPTRDWILPAA